MSLEKTVNFIKKIPKVIALAAGLSFLAPSIQAQNRKFTDFVDYYINAEAGLFTETGSLEILSIPEQIRDVPRHKNDGFYKDEYMDKLPNKGVSQLVNGNTLSAYLGMEFGKRITLGGLVHSRNYNLLEASDADEEWKDKTYITRRNYATRDPDSRRKMGTAFTYFGQLRLDSKKKNPLYGLFGRAKLYKKEELCGLYIQYEYVPDMPVRIDNGWDRYNRFEVKETYDLGKIDSHRVFLELKFEDTEVPLRVGAYLGAGWLNDFKINNQFVKSGGLKMNFKEPSFFAGIDISITFPFKR